MNHLCRLCSSNKNLVDLFHSALEGGKRLRYCILLASGIDIKPDDSISTMVCHHCCEIAVKLHKYRINAITNDKILKQKCGQLYEPPIVDPKELMKVAVTLDDYLIKEKDSLDLLDFKSTINPVSTVDIASRCKLKIREKLNLNQNHILKNNDVKPNISNHTIVTHPSVRKLLTENKNLILPKNVYGDDVLPLVSIDTNDLNEWYANHVCNLKDKLSGSSLEESLPSFEISGNSSDSESFAVNSRLRKRTNRRIIIDSDSDEDDKGILRKMPKKVPVSSTLQKTTDNVTSPLVSALNSTNAIQTNLKKLFTDFNKYGINIENTEPPISEETPIVVVDDSEVVCLSDKLEPPIEIFDSDAPSSNIDTEVKLLFEKHYSFNCRPKNTTVELNNLGSIVLQNMVPELKKYPIPVEIQYSYMPVARFLKRDPPKPKNSNVYLWSYKDCTDITRPTGQIVNVQTVKSVNQTTKTTTTTATTTTITTSFATVTGTTTTTTATPSNSIKVEAPAIQVVYGSLVPTNSKTQPIVQNTTVPSVSNTLYATPTFTQAPTMGTFIRANNNIYNVVPFVKNEPDDVNISSNVNTNVVIDKDSMPPLIPITRSLTTPATSTSSQTVPVTFNGNNGNILPKLQLKFCPQRTLEPVTRLVKKPNIIRKILPKVSESSTEEVPRSFGWHQVQTTEPLQAVTPTLTQVQGEEQSQPSRLLSLLTSNDASREITQPPQQHLQQPPTRPPSLIRVKNLSELIQN